MTGARSDNCESRENDGGTRDVAMYGKSGRGGENVPRENGRRTTREIANERISWSLFFLRPLLFKNVFLHH